MSSVFGKQFSKRSASLASGISPTALRILSSTAALLNALFSGGGRRYTPSLSKNGSRDCGMLVSSSFMSEKSDSGSLPARQANAEQTKSKTTCIFILTLVNLRCAMS